MKDKQRINVGIIGCGNISHTHIRAYQKIKEVQVVACADIDQDRGKNFSKKYKLTYFENYLSLLADERIELVSICTPHYLHKEMVIGALNAGKNVLCEKPLAITVSEAEEILTVVHETGKNFGVCYQNRFNESSLQLKHLLAEKKFGQLKGIKCFVTWHRDQEYYRASSWRGTWEKEGGGVLINQAIHTLDLITWLVSTPVKVKGKIMNSLLEQAVQVEDTAMATALINPNIPVNIFATTTYSSDPAPEIYFDFSKAAVKLTTEALVVNGVPVVFGKAMTENLGKTYWGQGHLRLLQAFIDKIQGRDTLDATYVPVSDAIDSLRLVQGIYQSAKENTWVALNKNN